MLEEFLDRHGAKIRTFCIVVGMPAAAVFCGLLLAYGERWARVL